MIKRPLKFFAGLLLLGGAFLGVATRPGGPTAAGPEGSAGDSLSSLRIASEYAPPAGIPAPPFGIDQTHWMYQGQLFDYDGDGVPEAPYQDAGNGPYTHYVDNTHPGCSNTQTHGTAAIPLCDPFGGGSAYTLPAGSVMEIRGGPYDYQGWRRFTAQGTASDPVFVRGFDLGNRVLIQGDNADTDLRLEGQFLVLENLEFYQGAFVRIWDGADHIAVRNLEIHNPIGETVGWGTALSAGEATRDIVLYQNHIHHNIRGNDLDLHGTGAGAGAERVWILENHIHHNSGDAFQACHYCDPAPRFVYVGGNEMHHDRENGVDLKTIRDVVVSENLLYGYEPSATSSGDAVVIGSNGLDPDQGYGPDNAWLLFNEIRDSHRGVRVEGVYNGWLIGNLIHSLSTEAIVLDIKDPSENVYIIGNTLSSAQEGLHHSWRCGVANVVIENNVFDDFSEHHIRLEPCVAAVSQVENNLFWNAGVDIGIEWGNASYTGLDAAGLNSTLGGRGNLIGDPQFTAADFFALQASSLAIDAGKVAGAYQAFLSEYGRVIRIDIEGVPRPQNNVWDIGAYEFVPSLQLIAFPAHQALHLGWTVNTTLPVTATWQVIYSGPAGDHPSPIIDIPAATREYSLTGLTNYVPYTMTLQAMLGGSPVLTGTVSAMPSDQLLLLPVVRKE